VYPNCSRAFLAGRNVEADEVERFLDPTVKRLMPDPDTLTGMTAAAVRIAGRDRTARSRSRSSATTDVGRRDICRNAGALPCAMPASSR